MQIRAETSIFGFVVHLEIRSVGGRGSHLSLSTCCCCFCDPILIQIPKAHFAVIADRGTRHLEAGDCNGASNPRAKQYFSRSG
jgi:hypothetical protein